MSNYLAIATVTATLSQLLQEAATGDVDGVTVTTGRPESVENGTPGPGINVYLYQVVPNTAWRNADLPTRRPDGKLVQRPQTALDLYYLLTFYGNDIELVPQRLLGSAVSALHSQPILTRKMIQATIDVAKDADPKHYLADSDLVQQVEAVKFTPLPLNLEELSKLWSVFFQTPYALSVTYRGSVVLIEGGGIPQKALPVRGSQFDSGPSRQPAIAQVISSEGANQPIVAGGRLVIRGQQLQGDVTQVRIGDEEVTPTPGDVSNTQISLPLPASLRAGVQGVQVIHLAMTDTPSALRRSAESNVAPFVLHPSITEEPTVDNVQGSSDEPRSADVTVQLVPAVGPEQRVVLLLNEPSKEVPVAYSFVAPPRGTDVDEITVPIRGVKATSYLVRVQVDGAESPLQADIDGYYSGPTVTIP